MGIKKRAEGRTIIFIHHSGKDGKQRGTSKREDILDTVITLKHPMDYEPSDGAMFEVHFEKARHLHGKSVKPFMAKLTYNNNKYEWNTQILSRSNKRRILELHSEGLSNTEIANVIGISRQAVHKQLKSIAK